MPIPAFRKYYPSVEDMSPEQHQFYEYVRTSFNKKKYPSVDGNISYLFAYVYSLLVKWNEKGFDYVSNQLLELAEAYHHEKKFSWYCKRWSYDCLIGLKRYEEYLILTEPEDIFRNTYFIINDRCNISYLLGKPLTGIDLVKLFGVQATAYTKKNSTAFRDFLEESFAEDAIKNGPWFDRLFATNQLNNSYKHTLFCGAPIYQPEVPFSYYCFYSASKILPSIREAVREAENRLREANNMPRVGEGWVRETDLFYSIKKAFPQTQVIQHGKPAWLGRQHLDIWLPRWKIAIEYHGTQHFEPIEFFGGKVAFDATRRRDARKKRLCKVNGVELIVVDSDMNFQHMVENIKQIRDAF